MKDIEALQREFSAANVEREFMAYTNLSKTPYFSEIITILDNANNFLLEVTKRSGAKGLEYAKFVSKYPKNIKNKQQRDLFDDDINLVLKYNHKYSGLCLLPHFFRRRKLYIVHDIYIERLAFDEVARMLA